MADSFPTEWPALWALFLLFVLFARREPRLLYRLPPLGALVWLAALACSPGPLVGTAAVLAGGCALPNLIGWLRAELRTTPPRRRLARSTKPWTYVGLALFALAAGSAFSLGAALLERWPLRDDLTLFESDAPLYARYLLGSDAGEHPIMDRHPLYLLMAAPPCRLGNTLLPPDHAVLLPSALAGAAALVLAAGYFRVVTGSRPLAVLLALALGATPAHSVFNALPETYAFSALGLILLHRLLAGRASGEKVRLRHETAASVLAIGATATHVLTAAVCFFASRLGLRRRRLALRWAAGVISLLAFLMVLQQALFPSPDPSTADTLRRQERYLLPDFRELGSAAVHVVSGFLADNVIAPGLAFHPDTDGHPGLHLGPTRSPWSRLALIGWWLALGSAVFLVASRPAARGTTLSAALVCLLAAAGWHLFYGYAHVFLYSCTFTFYLFALLAHGWRLLPTRVSIPAAGGLALLILLNTARFWGELFAFLDGLPPAG